MSFSKIPETGYSDFLKKNPDTQCPKYSYLSGRMLGLQHLESLTPRALTFNVLPAVRRYVGA